MNCKSANHNWERIDKHNPHRGVKCKDCKFEITFQEFERKKQQRLDRPVRWALDIGLHDID